MAATARMKLASGASQSESFPLAIEMPTCIQLSGHFMDIEGRVLVYMYQKENTNSVLLIMPHGDNGRFLVLILHPLNTVLSRSDDTSIPLAGFYGYTRYI